MNSGFVHSFYSPQSSWKHAANEFRVGNDELRAYIITRCHPSQWEHFEPIVKTWLSENWETWHRERPPWFSDHTISLFPLRLIPNGERIYKDNDELDCISSRGEAAESRMQRMTITNMDVLMDVVRSNFVEHVGEFKPKQYRSSSIAEENRMARINRSVAPMLDDDLIGYKDGDVKKEEGGGVDERSSKDRNRRASHFM